MKKIIVAGDIHCHWDHLNNLIKQESPHIILQCGDFGFWPHFHNSKKIIPNQIFDQYGIINPDTEIYWADGNHENHEVLQNLMFEHGRVPIEMEKFQNVYYMPRASVLTINHKNILFMGGAKSIDKNNRIPYVSWWPDEEISQKDIRYLPEIKIDIVISHTIPEKYLHIIDKNYCFGYVKDFSRKALDYVLEKYHPKQWFLGHWHLFEKFQKSGCEFTCLNMAKCEGWWLDISKYFY